MPENFPKRYEFYRFSEIKESTMKSVGRVINRHIDRALEKFYTAVRSDQELSAFFDDSSSMSRAKNLQAEHWMKVYEDGVDKKFHERSRNIGKVHAKIGLEPRWYVGAYSIVLEELITEMIAPGWQRHLPWKRAQAKKLVALVKVSLLDMDVVLSQYFADLNETRALVGDQLGSALEKLSHGDLTTRVDGFPAEFKKVELDFNSAIGSLNETMIALVASAESISTGSGEIRTASDDLARRTEEQAANLEETAAAISQTNQRVKEATEITEKAHRTIQQTNSMAESGSKIAAEAVSAMSQIEKSSEEINSIISVIDSIAFQTNLLALNAGVEAARAGETGKGFAVVASEVRALAQRCSDAAEEIKNLISASGEQVSAGVDRVTRTGEAFTSITKDVSDLSRAIQTIADSTNVQADSLAQINTVVGDLDRSTQQNAAMAEQFNAAAASLSREASKLRETTDYFQTEEEAATATAAGIANTALAA